MIWYFEKSTHILKTILSSLSGKNSAYILSYENVEV